MKNGHHIDIEAFWAEMAPGDHILQIYETEGEFLGMLERFICDGLRNRESVVVIATEGHLHALEQRLSSPELSPYRAQGKYMPLEAEKTLSRFMVNDWPDDRLFQRTIMEVLAEAARGGRNIRAFGEMVALLWEQGHNGATVRLEHQWNNLKKVYKFPLFCAYPRGGFTGNAAESMENICATHSKIVPTTCCRA
ncbi:MAG TPA: MEDS domain-containing protein [Verrucomicrobiae bacterium]|nr:MEDS domain-containing protein [Verrucomicrobiae bacterium]